jgi:hypothetical protein
VTAYALVAGTLWRAAETRTLSKTGKPFAVWNVRGLETWWSVAAFVETADELMRLKPSDAVSVSVPFTAEVDRWDGAPPPVSFRIGADHIASPQFGRPKEAA